MSENNAYLFLLLVLPGFIALSVYDLFIPARERTAATSFFLGISYGSVNLVLTWPLIFWAVSSIWSAEPLSLKVLRYVSLIFCLAIVPAFFGYATFRLRDGSWLGGLLHVTPHPTAWDSFFGRRQMCWVIFHLKSGMKLGAHYGCGSHASSFPNDQDVYVAEVWRLDEYGRFVEKVERTSGMIVAREECEWIEFFEEEFHNNGR